MSEVKKPFLVRVWGGSQAALEARAKPDAIEPGGAFAYWFATRVARDVFHASQRGRKGENLIWDKHDDVPDDKLVFACARLAYKGTTYDVELCYGYGIHDHITYMFKEGGNYTCDCNRSLFIQRQCDPAFPDLACGGQIELVELRIERRSVQ